MLQQAYAVDWTVAWKRNTGGLAYSREVIDSGDRFVADCARLYYTRPADNQGFAYAALLGITFAGSQGRIACHRQKTAVVAGEKHDCVGGEI